MMQKGLDQKKKTLGEKKNEIAELDRKILLDEKKLQPLEKELHFDLDAFAVKLEKHDFGITLYDTREEIDSCYRDKRIPYEPPTNEKLFGIVIDVQSDINIKKKKSN
ncbi:CLUMA_CG010186, isoform A [Clunio marinus]|uniref:CLUMA_CG010186, isoform A n=1 Tax=Clunio marinus TaxID=568069 RepID=A0A1J1IAH6_9DIPT|nr:CLUMA_CG010186, isoform A [Clunio marinus]